ncbi:MOSC domain-containing protein [Amphritea sp. 1_MG-2023]|uniref:MOSC domain-containing protein n=1 Tax=Amphritea sp. 1_MG-2023 TaxID=3062670 RepID=UPI0026E2AE50|nr:MOSC domain-containing protein [Amphritea sp. 1_MG-2023]MDO6562189.1 MOSC domain-containing protein [Amphritea sp. 1_MG-2023]
MSPSLSAITVYPIKSTAPVSLSRSSVTATGLAFDRQLVLCNEQGKFLTARTHPQLLTVKTALLPGGLMISAPGVEPLTLEYAALSQQYDEINVWHDQIRARYCGESAQRWFEALMQQPCKLYLFGEQSERAVSDKPAHQVAFADGYPLLLISQASLDDLNQRCQSTVLMQQMRPNLVIEHCEAYAEDSWKRIRVGEVEFEIVKPCGRCILTTTDPTTLQRNPDREPLSVLKKYRKGRDGEAHFGQNLIALNHGIISLDDPIEILETAAPERYPVTRDIS